jgi:excisionase family DNA binding protein
MKEDFLSAKQLQDWLGISKPTLLVWMRDSEDPLPGVKVGGRWKFRRQAVLEWWIRKEEKYLDGNRGKPSREKAKTKKVSAQEKEKSLEDWLAAATKIIAEASKK